MEINLAVVVDVRMITANLTTHELVALANAGSDPRGVAGYEKAKGLFTFASGTKMHQDTRTVFECVVEERLKHA